jgi:Flp pilus assembly protein TadD
MSKARIFFTEKLWPFLAGAGGAMVMILAFFIPSIQDQWDRYQSRKVIEQYEHLGDDFFDEEKFKMAEEAFAKAYELSENKRLDIEVKRLNAKISLIHQDPNWGTKAPESLKEIDFEFLLHLQKGEDQEKQRISTLNSYGIYLASEGRTKEAGDALKEAIALDPEDAMAYLNLGNVMDQIDEKENAEKLYRKAISLDAENILAHYNLGLLLSDLGKLKDAEMEFGAAVRIDPADSDACRQYKKVRQQISK